MLPSNKLQNFGHHLILGVSGTKLSDDDKKILRDLRPVGVIFFAPNFRQDVPYSVWLESLGDLTKQVREYAERDTYGGKPRMFVTIDHEGGRVMRPPLPITRFPYAAFYGEKAFAVGKAMGTELRSLGINISWSPVADIFSNPGNPVIGPRSFGVTQDTAAVCAAEYLRGLGEAGIIGCAKHFPGHGDTATDSHLELPVLNLTKEEMRSRELIPFQKLISAGIPLVMTAHILFPKIDPHAPATLSQLVLRDLLREELGFSGVVVSDDLDMKAVADLFTQPGTVAKSVNAGCDLFIISRNLPSSNVERVYAIASDFAASVDNGSLDESVVSAAKNRIDQLLAVTPQYDVSLLSKDVFLNHAELAIDCMLD
jgi:beta-N-acetylhexosaminidase